MAIGSGELVWGALIKFLPLKWFGCFNFDEKPMTEEEEAKSFKGKMKGSSSIHKKRTAEITEKVERDIQERMRRSTDKYR
jgi:hypothetical protein